MKPLEAALRYLEMNLSVIPVRQDKKPLVSWAEFQTRRPSEDEVKAWWKNSPNANVGIVTGPISNLFVVDTDTKESTEEIQNYLPENILTPIQTTPHGGQHFFFEHIEGFANRARLAPGTDIRTTGGFIVVDPSSNGEGNGWRWRDGLSLYEVTPAPLPGALHSYLKEFAFGFSKEATTDDKGMSSKVVKMFQRGTRDDDLFHAANCLVKGGMKYDNIYQVLNILGKNCNPPFPEKELSEKIKSAISRSDRKDRNLTEEVREWVLSSRGEFLSSEVRKCLFLSSREEEKNLSKALSRLKDEGIIESCGNRRGSFRTIEKDADEIDFMGAAEELVRIDWPFEIEKWVVTMPKNIIVIAGESNAGKTAFLLNTCLLNMGRFKINYFSSEMGALELRARLKKFEVNLQHWKDNINFRERSSNFADVIKPNDVNIVDFLEITDEFYKIGGMIKEIFDKLKKGVAIIALQKNPKTDFGLGGMRSVEKARLYIAMERGTIKIVKGKNWVGDVNPNGITRSFKLVQGAKFISTSEWKREN